MNINHWIVKSLVCTLLFAVGGLDMYAQKDKYLIEAEAFQFKGKWSTDRSADCMGSAMLRLNGGGSLDGQFDALTVVNIMEEGKANFHLCFLLQLCSFLGFSPNMETYRTGYFFDMLNGIFSPSRPIHTYTLDAREAEVFARLTRMDFNNLRHFKFNRGERNAILDRILTYYRLHQPDISELRSPEILRAIFD